MRGSLLSRVGALMVATPLFCSTTLGQDRVPWARGLSIRGEAIALLQDSLSSRLFLDSISIANVEEALLATRAQVPEVARIRVAPVKPVLTIFLEQKQGVEIRRDHAISLMPERPGVFPQWRLRRTGHRVADSLLGVHGAVTLDLVDWSGAYRSDQDFKIDIEFAHAMNLAAPRKLYEAVGFGMPAGPAFADLIWTDGFLSARDSVWSFHFVAGLGDCPAGCSGYDHYFIAYDPRSRAAKLARKWRGGWRVPDSPPNKPLQQTPRTR